MLKEDIAEPLQAIISSMYNLPNTTITLEEPNREISVKINLKNFSYMNFSYSQHKEKEKGYFKLETKDFPIYAYHNSIARLAPIYDQLVFLGKHPKYANSDIMMSFASTISNVSLMLGEETLIKTENNITEMIPVEHRQDIIIFCGPVGEYFVFTIHFVKPHNPTSSVSMSALNQNTNNSFIDNSNNGNGGTSQFSTMPNSFSTSAVSQVGNANNLSVNSSPGGNANSNNASTFTPPNNTNSNNGSSSANINLSATSSVAASANSSNTNLSSQPKLPTSRSNGNLSIMGSSSINSPLLEAATISPSLNYESPAFWRPFAQDTRFPHLGREYIVIDSVMLRTKFKIQTIVLSQLKALQMLLSAISVNLSVQAEEEEEIKEEEDRDDNSD